MPLPLIIEGGKSSMTLYVFITFPLILVLQAVIFYHQQKKEKK